MRFFIFSFFMINCLRSLSLANLFVLLLANIFNPNILQTPRHIKAPETISEKLSHPQDARHMQYNTWSKRYKIYSGSYLPKSHNDLTNKGWKKKKVSNTQHQFYQRKSTNQVVGFDEECLRFRADDVTVLAHSSEELDFSKYTDQ